MPEFLEADAAPSESQRQRGLSPSQSGGKRRSTRRNVVKPFYDARKSVSYQEDETNVIVAPKKVEGDIGAEVERNVENYLKEQGDHADEVPRDQFQLRTLHSRGSQRRSRVATTLEDEEEYTKSMLLTSEVAVDGAAAQAQEAKELTLSVPKELETTKITAAERFEGIRRKLALITATKVGASPTLRKRGWLQRAHNGWFSSWQDVWVDVGKKQVRWFSSEQDTKPLGILDFHLVKCEIEILWDCPELLARGKSSNNGSSPSGASPSPNLDGAAPRSVGGGIGGGGDTGKSSLVRDASGNATPPQRGTVRQSLSCMVCDVGGRSKGSGWAGWFGPSETATFRICPVDSNNALEFKAGTTAAGLEWVNVLANNIRRAEDEDGEEPADKISQQIPDSQDGRWWKVTRIAKAKFEQIARTGDLLLFTSPGTVPQFIRSASGGRFDHVALVLRLSGGGIGLLEATGTLGVGLVAWDEFVNREWHLIYSNLALRRVTFERSQEQITALQEWAITVLGKPYGLTWGKLMQRNSVSAGGDVHDGSFFCSELIAEALKVLGVLPRGKSSTQFWPSSFEVGVETLECNPGCSFDEELELDFRKERAELAAREGTAQKVDNSRDATTNLW